MKKLLFIVLIVFVSACKHQQQNAENSPQAPKDTVVRQKTTTQQETPQTINVPAFTFQPVALPKYLKNFPSTLEKFNTFNAKLHQKLTTFEQLQEIFALRDSLTAPLGDALLKNYEGDMLPQDLENELDSLGFMPIYTEGMFYGITEGDFLQKQIQLLAPEDFVLYQKFYSVYNDIGGEYPYSDMSLFFKAASFARQLKEKFPESRYYQKLKPDFKEVLLDMFDIHKVTSNNDTNCLQGGLHISLYPWLSDCEGLKKIYEDNPNSFFAPIAKNIYSTISQFNYSEGAFQIKIYAVVTDYAQNSKEATGIVFDYLTKGIDIPHIIKISYNPDFSYVVAYRFYSDQTKAQEALQKIKNKIPSAKIVTIAIMNQAKEITNKILE